MIAGLALIGAGTWYTIQPVIQDTSGNQSANQHHQTITVMAGGDVNMGRQTGQKILAGEIDYPFVNMGETLKSADIAFVNLESQLADLDGETQSPTNEYRFAGPPDGAKSLANAGIDIVSVANNHMWDYGKARLDETLTNLNNAGVTYVGANMDPAQVWTPKIVEVKDKKIAFLAMTNLLNGYENSGADEFVAFQDGPRLVQEIEKIKDKVDWVIVSIHSGTEYVDSPSSAMVQMSHDLIDAGADVILAGHPHVPQKIEEYVTDSNDSPSSAKAQNEAVPLRSAEQQNYEGQASTKSSERTGLILYSLGNFAFWQPFDFWTQHSFLAKLKLTESHQVEYEIIPINSGWQPSVSTDTSVIKQLMTRLNPMS